MYSHPRDGLPHAARPALGLMFMLHHKSDFHRVFAVHGGLEGLASRLQEEDQHVRAHAVEIFLRVTGDEALKWYVAPSTDDEVKMHRSLLDLGDRMTRIYGNARDCTRREGVPRPLAFWLGGRGRCTARRTF